MHSIAAWDSRQRLVNPAHLASRAEVVGSPGGRGCALHAEAPCSGGWDRMSAKRIHRIGAAGRERSRIACIGAPATVGTRARAIAAAVVLGLTVQPAAAQSLFDLFGGGQQGGNAQTPDGGSDRSAASNGSRQPGANASAATQARELSPPGLRSTIVDRSPTVQGGATAARPRDGDLTTPTTAAERLDGVFPLPTDGATNPDGLDAQTNDFRSAEERRNFEFETEDEADAFGFPATPGTPSSQNELLFQIEDFAPLDPTVNRRTEQFADLDPYAQLGIRVGTFVVFPEVEISAASLSNVLSGPNGERDFVGAFRPDVRIVSNWSNHALEFRGTGDLSEHARFDSENDRGFTVESRGRLDVTRRTNIQAEISRARAQEERSAVDAATAGERTNVETDQFRGAINHRFNRLSLQLRGAVTDSDFTETPTGLNGPGGLALTRPDRDNLERSAAVRATWEFKPTFQVFGEIEGNDRDFEAAAVVDDRLRNSQGMRLRGGIGFGQTSDILRGDVSVGYGRQDLSDGALEDASAVLFDANLAWRLSGLTTLLFTAGTDITDVTQTAGSGAVVAHRGGVEARHAFQRNLIGSIGIEGTRRDFAGIDVDETEAVFSMGLEYFMRREAVLFANWEHTVFRSDFDGSDFESDELRVGLRLRR
jgi:hypothetical protein